MIRSMTTFAKHEEAGHVWSFKAELKSVNTKFCEVIVRGPRWLNSMEDNIRRLVQKRMARGRLELTLQLERVSRDTSCLEPDMELALGYLNASNRIAHALGLNPIKDIAVLLTLFPGLITTRENGTDMDELWAFVSQAVSNLLEQAERMSLVEGEALAKDMKARLGLLETMLQKAADRAPVRLKEARAAMKKRIDTLADGISVDETRLAQECLILMDRMDVSEEITRAFSHIQQFKTCLDSHEPVGRKLDFLCQELFREINTLASKCVDVEMSHLAVEMKCEIEKIREQVQNVV
ncbi:MAG: YicC/YloC family endoribonuclease [Dissulfuribacterales bacterium]